MWLDSYNRENQGIIDRDVYDNISKTQYLALKQSGSITKATPSNWVLVINNYKDIKTLHAKSCIVALAKSEDRLYQKYQRYAPVLKYISLSLLTEREVEDKRIIQQGYWKNAFCNAQLPVDKVTMIRTPIGDPDFQEDEYLLLKKILYGLCHSPHHWYKTIK